MKKIISLITVSLLGMAASFAQDTKSIVVHPQENEPHEEVIVEKIYDEDGNVIGYDSTYVYSYSNMGDLTMMDDSTMQAFIREFESRMMGDGFFNDNFFGFGSMDSLMQMNSPGFFIEDMPDPAQLLEQMMQELEALEKQKQEEQEQN